MTKALRDSAWQSYWALQVIGGMVLFMVTQQLADSSLSDRIGPMTKVDKNDPNYIWYSPVEADSFEGLPSAYIETAEFDCLHDDGILYADLLRKAGVDVTLNETKGTMHGFDIATKAPTALAAMEQRIAFMKRMI